MSIDELETQPEPHDGEAPTAEHEATAAELEGPADQDAALAPGNGALALEQDDDAAAPGHEPLEGAQDDTVAAGNGALASEQDDDAAAPGHEPLEGAQDDTVAAGNGALASEQDDDAAAPGHEPPGDAQDEPLAVERDDGGDTTDHEALQAEQADDPVTTDHETLHDERGHDPVTTGRAALRVEQDEDPVTTDHEALDVEQDDPAGTTAQHALASEPYDGVAAGDQAPIAVEQGVAAVTLDTEPPHEEPPPRTRTCRVCSVEINAASARCPYCGARQFKRQPLLGWRGLLVLIVAVAAAVLITRAVIDAENGGLRFDAYDSVNLELFVPAGWQNLVLSGPHGTALAGYVNPSSSQETETVTASLSANGSPHSRALALYGQLATEPGVARGYHGSVTFPNSNVQWSDYYTYEGAYYAVFFSDACGGAIGVSVKLSSSSPTRLQELALVLPWSAAPHCDGPAFSSRSRADSAVPLAPQ